jgi:hypothetical protein
MIASRCAGETTQQSRGGGGTRMQRARVCVRACWPGRVRMFEGHFVTTWQRVIDAIAFAEPQVW